MESDVSTCRAWLEQMLGSKNFATYVEALRDLFGQKLTKETFDNIVSPFLSGDALSLHNLMILGILKKCDKDAKTLPFIEEEEIPENLPIVINDDSSSAEDSPIDVSLITIEKKAGEELEFPIPELKNRFPVGFSEKYQTVGGSSKRPTQFLPNVTQLYDIQDRIEENNIDKNYFHISEDGQPFTTHQSPYYGKCFLKAWSLGLDRIEIDAIDTAADFVYNHIRAIISAMLRQKKTFRRHLPKINTSYSLVGDAYPNPYLNQGYHSYDAFNRPEIINCGDTMQVPDHISSLEERERLGVLRMAANCPIPNPSPYERQTLTSSELLAVLKDNPRLIPDANMRTKVLIRTLDRLNSATRINSPVMESRDVFRPTFNIEEVAGEEGELMPMCNY